MADWLESYWAQREFIEGVAKAVRRPGIVGDTQPAGVPLSYFGRKLTSEEHRLVVAELIGNIDGRLGR